MTCQPSLILAMLTSTSVKEISPAKVNLFLAVIGPKDDGFHDLISVVSQLSLADELEFEIKKDGSLGGDTLILKQGPANLTLGPQNLILKAIALFRALHPFEGYVEVHLTKHIPMGAGLGGGSSNAVATLRGLNRCLGRPLSQEALAEMSCELGSDCRLFLEDSPCILRGRGDRVEPFTQISALQGQRLLVFKPDFPVDTAWAYKQMRAHPSVYIDSKHAESIVKNARTIEDLLKNNFEPIVFKKFLILQLLSEQILKKFGKRLHMSGSGSACYLLLERESPAQPFIETLQEILGESLFLNETRLC